MNGQTSALRFFFTVTLGTPTSPINWPAQTGTNMLETDFSASKMVGHLRSGPSGPYLDGFAAALERQAMAPARPCDICGRQRTSAMSWLGKGQCRATHIYSAAEIDRLIEAALRLRPKDGLRSRTYATLIALLSVTGLRISEALKLTVADVTRDRLVPLHDTAVAGLKRYLARRRPRSEADPVFVDARGLPLRYIAVKETFDRLVTFTSSSRCRRRSATSPTRTRR